MRCGCNQQDTLVDITDGYPGFADKFNTVEFGNWVKLMQCPECRQLWKVDEWDKYQTLYALKVSRGDGWERTNGVTRTGSGLAIQHMCYCKTVSDPVFSFFTRPRFLLHMLVDR